MDDRDELSRRLWLLREQMEQLVCALDIQQLVLANSRTRWLPMVTDNVEQLVDDIRASDTDRVAASQQVARRLGLHGDATLTELAAAVGEPYEGIWRQQRLHLLGLQAEVEEITSSNRELSRRGVAAAREILGYLDGDAHDTYDPHGGTQRLAPTSRRFDRTA
ncbi:MAG: flagellar export chaperone FlgN [Ilumatobacter sp.]|uniref:flagellar export chaperone FlgN n=1 Tax=Ilumatobacter sp. TaxID=1967498 RepID=UPI002620B67F|nr:flagellar export chaperone FlgN [Ilumatobacter sp.]MDJ0767428.1 flagellar export chaperone FlgN [Ilumatobacter sp.]